MQRNITALVIGVSKYPGKDSLLNPANDAEDMAGALEQLGFSVIKVLEATSEDVHRAVVSFKDNLNSNDVGLFYFAGHGMQVSGENYLNTIDTKWDDEITAKYSSYALNQLIDVMALCSNNTNIIILDACRTNPFVRGWNRGPGQRGLATVYSPPGTLIAFATSPGEVASDGKGRNGSYTEALLKHMNTHDVPVEEMFKRVRNTLSLITAGEQTSWEHTSLSGDFYFNISHGRSVDIYSQHAIADYSFAPTKKHPINAAIYALQSHDWYRQNPGLEKISNNDLLTADDDSLFVFGRNIYQAACGGANSASEYIEFFNAKTIGLLPEKIKAILDGMLFEVFFNSKGKIREGFKLAKFNELFDLKRFQNLSESFEFISEVLLTYQNRFYVIPGKSRNITVDVSTTLNDEGENVIDAINFEGFNILKKSDEFVSSSSGIFGTYPITLERLKERLSAEMVIPDHQLSVVTSLKDVDSKLLYPGGMTVQK